MQTDNISFSTTVTINGQELPCVELFDTPDGILLKDMHIDQIYGMSDIRLYCGYKNASDEELAAISIDYQIKDYDICDDILQIPTHYPIEIELPCDNMIMFIGIDRYIDPDKLFLSVEGSTLKSFGPKTFIYCGEKVNTAGQSMYVYRTYYTYNTGKYYITY